jgi:hypothetical protein
MGVRPVGHRSVEVGLGLYFQQKWLWGVGYENRVIW